MTRQRKWQLNQKEKGCCQKCGKDSGGHIHCPKHAGEFAAYLREWRKRKKRREVFLNSLLSSLQDYET